MSKKTRQKAVQSPVLEPVRVVTLASSRKALWRRSGLVIAGGLFVLANLAFRMVDAKTIAPTAFPMIVFLTATSIIVSVVYAVQHFLVMRRAAQQRWSKADWDRWRNGLEDS